MSLFNVDINGLTPPVLFELADHIRTFATQIETVANENEFRLAERRRNGYYKRSVIAASRYFSEQIENGLITEKALDEAAIKYCVSREAITIHVSMFKAKQRRIEKINRDQKIMRMWRAGYPVRDIAVKKKLTVRTVQRIVKTHKEI